MCFTSNPHPKNKKAYQLPLFHGHVCMWRYWADKLALKYDNFNYRTEIWLTEADFQTPGLISKPKRCIRRFKLSWLCTFDIQCTCLFNYIYEYSAQSYKVCITILTPLAPNSHPYRYLTLMIQDQGTLIS